MHEVQENRKDADEKGGRQAAEIHVQLFFFYKGTFL